MNYAIQKGGTDYIRSLIDAAVQDGSRCATVRGDWEIKAAIRLPSNFTLILEDCHLRLADGCYASIFVNEHNETEIGKTVDGTDRNISIIGRGNAILDGGEYNGLGEMTPPEKRPAPLYKNNLILFTNVNGFKISGLKCINQRWWATNFIYCRNGSIENMDFCADDRRFDKDRTLVHGLIQGDNYSNIYVKNADGIDLREGCQNIVIENITGFTEDDTIALTGLAGKLEAAFRVEGLSSDICNVKINNIRAAAFCSIVRLLNQGEIKLHDIEIDGVFDTSENSPHLNRGARAIRVGDKYLYGPRHCTKDETYNISIKNVYAAGISALALAGEIGNLVICGIECAKGTKMFEE